MKFEKNTQISELYDFRHRNDKLLNTGYDYSENLFKDTLSPHIFKNEITSGFLTQLEQLVVHMMKSNVLVRNWFNHTVSKYYDGHNN